MDEKNEKTGNATLEKLASGWSRLGGRLAKLVEVKSLVTLTMTAAMVGLLFTQWEVSKDMLMLFSSSFGAVITYFFTRKDGGGGTTGDGEQR